MSLTNDEFRALLRHVEANFPMIAADERRELVQISVEAAPATTGQDAEASLFDLALAALPKVARQRREQRWRRVVEPDLETAAGEPSPEPVRRPRAARMPHAPKGVVPFTYPDGDVRMIPVEVGDPLNATERLMLHRLRADLVEPLERDGLISPERRAALRQAYGALFSAPPEQAWAQVLTEEIRQAKLELLTQEARRATAAARTPPSPPSGYDTSAALTLTAKGREARPGMVTNQTVNVRPTPEGVAVDHTTFVLTADIGGHPTIIGRLVGHLGPTTQGAILPDDPASRAKALLRRTIERLALWPGSPKLPEYVLDPQLIQTLVHRMGFDGGGGPRRVLSAQRVFELLVDPAALADDVEAYGAALADRLDEDRAEETDAGFGQIVRGIRERVAGRLVEGA